jgi:hypothetical protein
MPFRIFTGYAKISALAFTTFFVDLRFDHRHP